MSETRLHRSYVTRLARVRTRALALVLGSDTANTKAFVDAVVPRVLAAQAAVVTQADAYLSSEAGMATGSSTEPWGLDATALIGVHARRGEFLEDVYARNHRATESTFAERMAREVNTDLTLAERGATFVHTQGDQRIVGYRRVLSAGKNCGLCAAAATQRYSKGDLRPIHYSCGCTTQPIYGDAAGWTKPSRASLRSLYEQAGSTSGSSLRRITAPNLPPVEVVEDVLGPTLVAA